MTEKSVEKDVTDTSAIYSGSAFTEYYSAAAAAASHAYYGHTTPTDIARSSYSAFDPRGALMPTAPYTKQHLDVSADKYATPPWVPLTPMWDENAPSPSFMTRYDNSASLASNHQGTSGAASQMPKRKRKTTPAQRHAANVRERRRMCSLNSAFDRLRRRVPAFPHEKRLSRIQTLRLAMTYIAFMTEMLTGQDMRTLLPQRQDTKSAMWHAYDPTLSAQGLPSSYISSQI